MMMDSSSDAASFKKRDESKKKVKRETENVLPMSLRPYLTDQERGAT